MPCRSDYMEPTHKERLLQETAQLLVYVRTELGMAISEPLARASRDIYCRLDYVSDLCHILHTLPEGDFDRIVYNSRNRTARRLADWWEEHEAADLRRLAEEQAKIDLQNRYEQVIMKLSDEEIAVLKEVWGVE